MACGQKGHYPRNAPELGHVRFGGDSTVDPRRHAAGAANALCIYHGHPQRPILIGTLLNSSIHSSGRPFNESCHSIGLGDVDGVAALYVNDRGAHTKEPACDRLSRTDFCKSAKLTGIEVEEMAL